MFVLKLTLCLFFLMDFETIVDATSCEYGRTACFASCYIKNCATGDCPKGPKGVCKCDRCVKGPHRPFAS